SDRNIDIEAGGGVAVNFFSTEHFPVKSYGFYNTFNITGSLFARKLFRAGNLNITPGIDASYRMNLSSDISYIIQPLSIPEMVYHDYFVSKANVISGVLSVRLEMPVSKNKFVKSVFFVPQGSWAAAPGSEAGDITGYMISAVAGLTF
ncbi:MAG TPA: hypothetical protein VMV74_01465, partial [Bacteroidales bacterium]|nr:hypothetical protein [Bacteroidales bacterium]